MNLSDFLRLQMEAFLKTDLLNIEEKISYEYPKELLNDVNEYENQKKNGTVEKVTLDEFVRKYGWDK